jgi:hypothetical protein
MNPKEGKIRDSTLPLWKPQPDDFKNTTDEELTILFEEGEKHFKAAHINCSDSLNRTNFLSTAMIAISVALTGFTADRYSKYGIRDLLFLSSFLTVIYLSFLIVFLIQRILKVIRINLEGVNPNEIFNNDFINSYSGKEKIRAYYIQRVIWFNTDLDYIFGASNKRWKLYRTLQRLTLCLPIILVGSFIIFALLERYCII